MLCNMLPKSRAAGYLAGEDESVEAARLTCISVLQPAGKTDCHTQTRWKIYCEESKLYYY